MQRYFVKNSQIREAHVVCDAGMAKHMSRVMRYSPGDHVHVVDEDKHVFLCVIDDEGASSLSIVSKVEEHNDPTVDVRLVYGIPKGDKFTFVLQKATELGVSEVIPLQARRSVAKFDAKRFASKRERFEKILQEAAEQSERESVPVLHEPVRVEDLKDYLSGANLVAYEESGRAGEVSALRQALSSHPSSVTIVVGPEGGFDESEIEAMEAMGFARCGLGPRILRSETAPLYLLSVISYESEL